MDDSDDFLAQFRTLQTATSRINHIINKKSTSSDSQGSKQVLAKLEVVEKKLNDLSKDEDVKEVLNEVSELRDDHRSFKMKIAGEIEGIKKTLDTQDDMIEGIFWELREIRKEMAEIKKNEQEKSKDESERSESSESETETTVGTQVQNAEKDATFEIKREIPQLEKARDYPKTFDKVASIKNETLEDQEEKDVETPLYGLKRKNIKREMEFPIQDVGEELERTHNYKARLQTSQQQHEFEYLIGGKWKMRSSENRNLYENLMFDFVDRSKRCGKISYNRREFVFVGKYLKSFTNDEPDPCFPDNFEFEGNSLDYTNKKRCFVSRHSLDKKLLKQDIKIYLENRKLVVCSELYEVEERDEDEFDKKMVTCKCVYERSQ